MKFTISVLIVGLVICPFIHTTAAPTDGATTTNATERDDSGFAPATVSPASPFRAQRKSEEETEEDDEFDLNDIMSIFGGPPQEYSHVKRSSNDYYLDMDMAASGPKEQQYSWKIAQPKSSNSAPKKRDINVPVKSSNGKVYTLHIVTNGEQQLENAFSNGNQRSNNHNNYNNQQNIGVIRTRSPRSKIHVIPITMRSNGKSGQGKARIVKRYRGTRPDDHHIKYDSHSHSEEVQDIILPAESENVDTKYEDKYEIIGTKDIHTNDLKLAEGNEGHESQYLDHDPYEPNPEKIKVKHHHHHHHHNHVKTVIKKVPQPYPVEKIVHVPVEKVVHVPKPYPVDKFVEKIVHVPVERVIQVPRPVPVDRIVEKVVHVPKPYPVDRIVEKPVHVNRPVRVNVPYPVDRIVHVPKPYPVEKIVEKLVHVPKPYPVIKHVHVPVPVEKKVPYPVKVEVEKKVPYPVKVFIPKPYPVEKKIPDMDQPPKKNSYRTNFEKNRMAGAQSYQNINHGHNHFQSTSGRDQSPQFTSQGNHNQQQQFEQHTFMPQMTSGGMDFGYAQQTQQQAAYPYQFEQGGNGGSNSEMQFGVNVMAAQPTGSESEQQDYVYNTSEQAQDPQQSMGPSGGGSLSDSADAASTDSLVNEAALTDHSDDVDGVHGEVVGSQSSGGGSGGGQQSFQINVPDHAATAMAVEPQFGESKTVSHLLQITPFTSDQKQMAFTRPVDQFVVFHTGTGFTVPKRK